MYARSHYDIMVKPDLKMIGCSMAQDNTGRFYAVALLADRSAGN